MTRSNSNDVLEIKKLSEIQSTKVEWLWYPYIPLGKLTIIQGDPGSGKTMLILYLASLISSGSPLPNEDSNVSHEPTTVIYQTSEDGYEDTIKPRLEMFPSTNFDNIVFINEDKYPLNMLDERIELAVIKENAKLFILDPIQAYIGQNIDMNRANEMRPLLKNLGDIAQKYQVAIVLIGHMNKGKGTKSSYHRLGSIDIPAAARSVLICGELRNSNGIRAVIQDKSSLSQRGNPFAFRITDNGIEWLGEYEVDVEELLDGNKKMTDKECAKEWLSAILNDKPFPANKIYQMSYEQNFSKRTLDQAKSELNIQSYKEGKNWYWRLN